MRCKKLFLFLAVSVLLVGLVIAAHTISLTPASVDEDTSNFYNVSVVNGDAGTSANITQVNITVHSSFTFTFDTNGSDAGLHSFVNTSNVLSWENATTLVNGSDTRYFTFNLSATTPGTYNFTVETTNATDTVESNVSIVINDTTVPSVVKFVSPTAADNANLSGTTVALNVSFSDNGVIDSVYAMLYNSTDEVNSSNAASSPFYVNFSGISDGVYYFNATVNDTFGNSNNTVTRTVNFDSVAPVVILISPAGGASASTSAYNFTFNVTDDGYVSNCTLYVDGSAINVASGVNNTGATQGLYNSSFSAATHTWVVNCTDAHGNTGNSSTRVFTVTSSTTSSSSSSSGGGSSLTNTLTESQLSEGYKKSLHKNSKLYFSLEGESHSLLVGDINSTSAVVSVSSETQEVTLNEGESTRFELNGDDIYDLSVELVSIDYSISYYPEVEIIVKSISESISEEVAEESGEVVSDEGDMADEDEGQSGVGIIVLVVLILIIIAVAIIYKLRSK